MLLAQPDSTYFPFLADWAPGSSHYFLITDTKNQWENSELLASDTMISLANLHVKESNSEGFLVSWRQNISPEELGYEANESVEYSPTEIIYQMDSLGTISSIKNWHELSEIAMNQVMVALANEPGYTEDTIAATRIIQPMIDQLKTEEGVKAFLADEIQLLHFPFGRAFSTEKTEHFNTALPNPMGGAPFAAVGQLYIDTIDRESSVCYLVQEIKIDPKQTHKILEDLFMKLGAPLEEIEPELKKAKLENDKILSYAFDYQTTVPRMVSLTNETYTSFGGREQIKLKNQTIKWITPSTQ